MDGGKVDEKKLADVALFGLSVSPTGHLIAVGDQRGRIYLCGADKNVQALVGHDDNVRTLEFSAGGTWLFSGSKDRTVRMWHCASGQTWILAQVEDYVYEVSLSPDGQMLAVVDGAGFASCIHFPRTVEKLTPHEVSVLVENWDGFQPQ